MTQRIVVAFDHFAETHRSRPLRTTACKSPGSMPHSGLDEPFLVRLFVSLSPFCRAGQVV